jgi:hypothetical protein
MNENGLVRNQDALLNDKKPQQEGIVKQQYVVSGLHGRELNGPMHMK